MSRLTWDNSGEHFYETGIKNVVIYKASSSGTYPKGAAWNGVTGITESPSGAESNAQYADDIKYLNLISAEEYGSTLTAFTYPDEFAECNGELEVADGVTIGQQARPSFGLSYRTAVGNDTLGSDFGYKLHLVYGLKASPSERAYQTINDSPEAIEFSWELDSTPVAVKGKKPTSVLTVDSRKTPKAKMEALEAILYGSDEAEARLPLPDEVIELVGKAGL